MLGRYAVAMSQRSAAAGGFPDVPIRDESIRLGQFLKLAGLIDSGADAKAVIAHGGVTVNGETELRRGRQLHVGDVVVHGAAGARVAAG
jgi:ribosome-associated protein